MPKNTTLILSFLTFASPPPPPATAHRNFCVSFGVAFNSRDTGSGYDASEAEFLCGSPIRQSTDVTGPLPTLALRAQYPVRGEPQGHRPLQVPCRFRPRRKHHQRLQAPVHQVGGAGCAKDRYGVIMKQGFWMREGRRGDHSFPSSEMTNVLTTTAADRPSACACACRELVASTPSATLAITALCATARATTAVILTFAATEKVWMVCRT